MPWFSETSRFFNFENGLRETERSYNLWERVKTSNRRFFFMKWSCNICQFHDSLTSQSRAIPSQSQKILKFVKIMALIILNCESMFDLTDVSASTYDRRMDARPFDTINDILRCLSLAQSLLKGRNAPIWHIGNRRVKSNFLRNMHPSLFITSFLKLK